MQTMYYYTLNMHQDIISKKLVLIEDDEVLVEVYKMILEEAG